MWKRALSTNSREDLVKLEVLVDPGGWTNYWGNVTDTRNIAKVLDVFSRFLQISNINIRMESTPGFRTVQNYFKAFDMEILEFSSWHQLVTKRCTATKKICRKNNLVFHDIDVLCHHLMVLSWRQIQLYFIYLPG